MASESTSATVDEQPTEWSGETIQKEYASTGLHPLGGWSKLLLGLIALFSVGIFAPVLVNRELMVMGAPWLFYAYPVSILTLSISWLVLMYTVVE